MHMLKTAAIVYCAYISATWFQKHLSKCPQPTGAIMGLNLTELNNKSNNNNH